MEALNFDADGANQLKRAFKRFDKDGDGKLSEEEFVHVLGQLGGGNGLAPEECKQLFQAVDKDDNGKLTVSDWLGVLSFTSHFLAGLRSSIIGKKCQFLGHFL